MLWGAVFLFFTSDTLCSIIYMSRIKRGGYFFEWWVGDHNPPHVHISDDRRLIAKVALDKCLTLMNGRINRRIRKILTELVERGVL